MSHKGSILLYVAGNTCIKIEPALWRTCPGAGAPSVILCRRVIYTCERSGVFPGDTSGKELTCQCRRRKRRGFDPEVGKIPWRRAWKPCPVFLPWECHGQRILVDYGPWGCKESDMTELTMPSHRHWYDDMLPLNILEPILYSLSQTELYVYTMPCFWVET